jgi:hypothetical protein
MEQIQPCHIHKGSIKPNFDISHSFSTIVPSVGLVREAQIPETTVIHCFPESLHTTLLSIVAADLFMAMQGLIEISCT